MKKQASVAVYLFYLSLWLAPLALLCSGFLDVRGLLSVFSPRNTGILLFSLAQAALSTAAAFLLALLPGVYLSKKSGFLSKIIASTLFIPFFYPVVSAVTAFSLLYSDTGILAHAFGFHGFLYTLPAVIFAHALYNAPIFVSYLGEALRKVPEELIESAKTEGASGLQIFIRIKLQLVMPALRKACLLVFVYSFTSFGVILAIGGGGFFNLETAIVTEMRGSFDFSRALGLALLQLAVVSALAFLNFRSDGVNDDLQPSQGKAGPVFTAGSLLFLALELSFVGAGLFASVWRFDFARFDLSPYLQLFSRELNAKFHIWEGVRNSAFLSLFAAAVVTVLSMAMIKLKRSWSDGVVTATLGISAAVLSISLLYLNIRFGVPMGALLLLGYVLLAFPVAWSYLDFHVRQFDPAILEAARVDGAGRVQAFLFVELPLLLPSLAVSTLQVFAVLYGEFTVAYTMQADQFLPLSPLSNFALATSHHARESAAFSTVNLLLVLAAFLITHRLSSVQKVVRDNRP